MQEIEEFLNTYSSLNQIQIHGDQNDRITLVSWIIVFYINLIFMFCLM